MDDLAFTQNIYTEVKTIEKVLHIVQSLDPEGVAARTLEECLLLQLKRKEMTPSVELAIQLLEKSFEQFTKKHYQKLIQKHNITEEQLKDAISEIERLNPKPGGPTPETTELWNTWSPIFPFALLTGNWSLP